MASSKTAASAAVTPSNSAARRNESGAGLPGMPSVRMVTPSTRQSTNGVSPASSSTSAALALDDTTPMATPASRTTCR